MWAVTKDDTSHIRSMISRQSVEIKTYNTSQVYKVTSRLLTTRSRLDMKEVIESIKPY